MQCLRQKLEMNPMDGMECAEIGYWLLWKRPCVLATMQAYLDADAGVAILAGIRDGLDRLAITAEHSV